MTEAEMPETRRPSQQHNVWRVIRWAGFAAIAMAAVVFVSQTDPGSERLELAVFGAGAPAVASVQIPEPATGPALNTAEAETNRLAEEARALTADRDRLAARLASLERQIEDMTGSIGRQPASPSPDVAARKEPAEPLSAPTPMAVATPTPIAVPAPLPPAGAPTMLPRFAEIAPLPGEAPRIFDPFSMQSAPAHEAVWPQPSKEKSSPEEMKPVMVLVPLPPPPPPRTAAAPARAEQRVAALHAAERPAPAAKPDAAPAIEIGLDIGGSFSTGSLAGQWTAMKANFGPLLTGLRPAIGRDHRFGHAPFRLLIGPLPNPVAASRLCARLAAAGVECRPARFEGQQLAQF